MLARLATVVFSLVVGITPIAPEVCGLLCTSSMPSHHMMAHGAHDACGPQVSEVPACCAHTDRSPASPVSAAKIVINPPLMLAHSVSVQIVDAIAIDISLAVNSPRTPIPLSLRTPLRV